MLLHLPYVYPWMLGAMWALSECLQEAKKMNKRGTDNWYTSKWSTSGGCVPWTPRHHSFPWSTGSSCCHIVASRIHLIHNKFDLVTSVLKHLNSPQDRSKVSAWLKQSLWSGSIRLHLYSCVFILPSLFLNFVPEQHPIIGGWFFVSSSKHQCAFGHMRPPFRRDHSVKTPTILLEMAQMKPSCSMLLYPCSAPVIFTLVQ